jgi:hypothetical protein
LDEIQVNLNRKHSEEEHGEQNAKLQRAERRVEGKREVRDVALRDVWKLRH